MKQRQLVDRRASRMGVVDTIIETGGGKLVVKYVVPIGAERVRIAKAVASDFIAFVNVHGARHKPPGQFAIGAAYRIMRAASQR